MSEKSGGRNRKQSRGRGGSGRGGATSKNKKAGTRKNVPTVDPAEFWGEAERMPERIAGLTHSPDVRAVLTSLGRPPLTGNETAAEHWFSMVYERAAFLAGALAAAGGLDEIGDPEGG